MTSHFSREDMKRIRRLWWHLSWEFDAHYGRTGTIRRTFLTCHVCKKDGDGISIDSSEGEYGPGNICRDCIDLAFSERINI